MRDLEATDLANKQPSIYLHGMESVGTSSYSLRSLLIVILAFKICSQIIVILTVRNRTPTLIEREDDTRSWGNFLVYFSHSITMSYPPRGWGYILIGC
jgi:hypothetical protein